MESALLETTIGLAGKSGRFSLFSGNLGRLANLTKRGWSMKVFMSWSGARSKAAAELLAIWAKCVIQATEPWISTSGIDRGAVWFTTINDELKDTTVGIVCLTHENKNRPWILFEAGALAKGIAENRVCTFLVDLTSRDLQSPLSQFNGTTADRDGLMSLALTLNNAVASPLPQNILMQVFDRNWDWFNKEFQALLQANPLDAVPEIRTEESLLTEILESVRGLNQRIRTIEDRQRVTPFADLPRYGENRTVSHFYPSGELEQSLADVAELMNSNGPMDYITGTIYERFGLKRGKELINIYMTKSRQNQDVAT